MATVRPAEPADVARITALLDTLFPDDPIRPPDAEFQARAAEGNPYLFVAVEDDTVAGFVVLRDRPLRLWTGVDYVGVDPAFSGRGLGTALTLHALQAARRPLVRLFVRPSNTRAFELYRRCGFRTTGRRKGNYPDGEDAILMIAPSRRFTLFPRRAVAKIPERRSA